MSDFKNYKEFFESLPVEHQNIIKNANKMKQRFNRNGDGIVRNKGRKKVSDSHKKEVRRLYAKKKAEKIRAEKIANGTYKPRGRPRNVKEKE